MRPHSSWPIAVLTPTGQHTYPHACLLASCSPNVFNLASPACRSVCSSYRASKLVHAGTLTALLAAPLSFFEATPVGRCGVCVAGRGRMNAERLRVAGRLCAFSFPT